MEITRETLFSRFFFESRRSARAARATPPSQRGGFPYASEKDTKLAQKLGQLRPFTAVFPQGCMNQLASFGPT